MRRATRCFQALPAICLGAAALVHGGCDRWSGAEAGGSIAVRSAQFGLLYGGQIQQRQEIPFELQAGKQRLGFRLVFESPLTAATRVEWELSQPGPRTARDLPVSDPDGRITRLGTATVPAGAGRFDHSFALQPGDPLGLWNVRVTLGPQLVIDRPFMVFDPVARRRAIEAAKIPDAGF